MATTYVSFLVKSPTDPIEPQQRIEWLKPLLALNIDLVLCVDLFYVKLIPSPISKRIRILVIDLDDFETAKQIRTANPALPPHRNQTKDTLDYMVIQNSKPELLKKALQLVYTPYVAYIDAGISKIFKQPHTLKLLEMFRFKDIPLVLLPGCHPIPTVPPTIEQLAAKINWTFCGGFFVVASKQVETLFELHRAAVQNFLDAGKISWEVNVWVSYLTSANAIWYSGDHIDKMLTLIPKANLAP